MPAYAFLPTPPFRQGYKRTGAEVVQQIHRPEHLEWTHIEVDQPAIYAAYCQLVDANRQGVIFYQGDCTFVFNHESARHS